MTKKSLSTLVLILALMFSFNVSVFADEVETTEQIAIEQSIELPTDTNSPVPEFPIIIFSHFPYEH